MKDRATVVRGELLVQLQLRVFAGFIVVVSASPVPLLEVLLFSHLDVLIDDLYITIPIGSIVFMRETCEKSSNELTVISSLPKECISW